MHRVNFHLTDKQRVALKKMSKAGGLTVAELIRRAVDAYVKKQAK
jgi:hypothetical protein